MYQPKIVKTELNKLRLGSLLSVTHGELRPPVDLTLSKPLPSFRLVSSFLRLNISCGNWAAAVRSSHSLTEVTEGAVITKEPDLQRERVNNAAGGFV